MTGLGGIRKPEVFRTEYSHRSATHPATSEDELQVCLSVFKLTASVLQRVAWIPFVG